MPRHNNRRDRLCPIGKTSSFKGRKSTPLFDTIKEEAYPTHKPTPSMCNQKVIRDNKLNKPVKTVKTGMIHANSPLNDSLSNLEDARLYGIRSRI